MQIPILNGIYADVASDFRTSYPRNMAPVVKKQGISEGYLRPAEGIIEYGSGPGVDRGGINWNGVLYRVMGSKLCSVSTNGVISILADVGGTAEQVTFDYSFDRLAIASAGKLFYWVGSSLIQVTDIDLGTVLDFIFIDGYFMTTDGNYLVVTDLADPLAVNPLKYGSSEADPDPVKGLIKIGGEAYSVGRHTIEVFSNTGGTLFPFSRISGAQVPRGSIGTHAACSFGVDNHTGVAFLGGGRNEPLSVWFAVNGVSIELATREVCTIIRQYSEAQLSNVILESRTDKNQKFLYVHLPDQTLVYNPTVSAEAGEPVWFVLTSSLVGTGTYRARNFVWCYDKWISGDPTTTKLGYFTDTESHHYGAVNGWEFGTMIVYNDGNGAIFHELELVALTGSVASGVDPVVWTSYSLDGITWSQERPRTVGRQGERNVRINWLSQGNMKNWRIQKFRGTSDAHISVARLEARIEQLVN